MIRQEGRERMVVKTVVKSDEWMLEALKIKENTDQNM